MDSSSRERAQAEIRELENKVRMMVGELVSSIMDCVCFVQRKEKVLSHGSSRPRGWMGSESRVGKKLLSRYQQPTAEMKVVPLIMVSVGTEQVRESQRNQTVGSTENRAGSVHVQGKGPFTHREERRIFL